MIIETIKLAGLFLLVFIVMRILGKTYCLSGQLMI